MFKFWLIQLPGKDLEFKVSYELKEKLLSVLSEVETIVARASLRAWCNQNDKKGMGRPSCWVFFLLLFFFFMMLPKAVS